MSPVQLAEKALADAKQQEKKDIRQQELNALITEYQGRCFGSHTFERNHGAASMGATYYEKFYIKDDEIYVQEWNVRLDHRDDLYKKCMKNVNYASDVREKQLTGLNNYNADYNLYSGYNFYRKDISYATFMQLWESGEEANIIIKNAFRGKVAQLEIEQITQGDYGQEKQIDICIKDMGIEMIDFKDHPSVHDCIKYRTLPMFDKRRWMPKQYAKPILEWQIKQLQNDCNSVWATDRRTEALMVEIKIIRNFINKYL